MSRQTGLKVLFEAQGYVKKTGKYEYKSKTAIVYKDIPMPSRVLNRNIIDSYFAEWLTTTFTHTDNYRWNFKV